MSVKTSEEKELGICEKYNNGAKTKDLALEYKIYQSNIIRILRRNNIKLRPDNLTNGKKYTLNEHYFDIINSPEKAYWFGWLLSDGNSSKDGYHIKLSLQEKDKEILDKFNIAIDSNKPLGYIKLKEKNPNWSNVYSLHLSNKYMSKKLAELGMIPNKSLVLKFPKWLKKKFHRSFILSYFEGDGCIYIRKNGEPSFNIVGTKEFLTEVQKILIKELGLNKTKLYQKNINNSYALNYSGRPQCIKIRNWLYKEANKTGLYLKRKHDKFYSIK